MSSGTGTGQEYQTLQSIRSTGQQDWTQLASDVQDQAKSGQLPQHYAKVAQTVQRHVDSMPENQKQYLRNLPPDVTPSFFHLLGCIGSVAQSDPTQAKEIAKFFSTTIQESTESMK